AGPRGMGLFRFDAEPMRHRAEPVGRERPPRTVESDKRDGNAATPWFGAVVAEVLVVVSLRERACQVDGSSPLRELRVIAWALWHRLLTETRPLARLLEHGHTSYH